MTDRHSGLERFAADLPPVTSFVSLGEGDTPLVELPRLTAELGLARLRAKLESLNPTGSYKDRIAAMSVSLALRDGMSGWIATSSGNAGMAMAAYGTRAGLPGCLCMVASAPAEKRLSILPYATELLLVEGVGRAATRAAERGLFDEVRAAAERHNLYLGITAHEFNPEGMRGADTIGYELAEQAPSMSHLYVPTGGGGLLVAIARGLRSRGSRTKVVACQPSGCAPIARYLAGEIDHPHVGACNSDISALQLPSPPDGRRAAESVRSTRGWAGAVPDTAILEAQRALASTEGVFAEPASACALAVLIDDVRRGRIGSHDDVVLVVTGAGWKDLNRFHGDAERLRTVAVRDVATNVDDWMSSRRASVSATLSEVR
ncbi:pyridoxal-phosphate dependent enzyme [Amycolatopsis tucumanensis]|uniref:Threonine synthase n=1 Tax=Amycolatopsis tucumanensis TaxID=401106 RepID=A0ABP7I766_9PSEU|nr:pyridoxal-phosphate dependent enzyme [Amycolatopsis tucumanensis]MCF6426191.1 pyridoxal-phosphate dependent enzyme [Amycolatopsis tucumanensis]